MRIDQLDGQFIYHIAVGSRLHGIMVGGQCDEDQMAVFMPTPRQGVGFHTIDTVVHRPGRGPQEPSRPGDLDLTVYSLGKYVRLFLKGNPSVVQTAWVPADLVYLMGPGAPDMLMALRTWGISRRFIKATHGYMRAQIAGLDGSRGTRVKRPKLVAAHGYDVKYAFHAMRLGLGGVELAQTGKLVLPLTDRRHPMPVWVERMRAVRMGEVEYGQATEWLGDIVGMLEGYTHGGPLPEHPDEKRVEDWYMSALRQAWHGAAW